MSIDFLRTLLLVTLGAFVIGHIAVRWAVRKADPGEIVPSIAIGCSSIALGLALREPGTLAFAVQMAALGLLASGLLMLARRKIGQAR